MILTSFFVFGLTPSAGLVTEDKCIIKQHLSQLKLQVHNEMHAGVEIGGVVWGASEE